MSINVTLFLRNKVTLIKLIEGSILYTVQDYCKQTNILVEKRKNRNSSEFPPSEVISERRGYRLQANFSLKLTAEQ